MEAVAVRRPPVAVRRHCFFAFVAALRWVRERCQFYSYVLRCSPSVPMRKNERKRLKRTTLEESHA